MQRIFIFAILLLTLLIGCKVFHCIFIVYILLNFILWHLKKKKIPTSVARHKIFSNRVIWPYPKTSEKS